MTYYLLHNGQPSAQRLARRAGDVVPVRELRTVSRDDVVIHYGNATEVSGGLWEANRPEGIRLTQSRPLMLKALAAVGVRAGNRPQLARHYQVPVFNLQAIGCFRTESKNVWLNKRLNEVVDSFSEISGDLDEQARRVSLMAVRAVHALGLEFALVTLGVNPHGRIFVLDVAPAPVLKGRLLELFRAGLVNYMEAMENSQADRSALLLGTDLEFMLKGRRGKLVLASHYFPSKGKIGCDDRTYAGDRTKRPLAEIRPDPAATPEEVCRNIADALAQAVRMNGAPYPEWLAGSAPFERFPIGGHVHFSGLPYTARLVNLLDVYVGLPLMLIEDPVSAGRRRPKYGFLGDIRHKSHGGFEYRTPASFLVDPDIALGTLSLAYIVALYHGQLPYLPLHSGDHVRAFYENDRERLLTLVTRVHEHVRRTPAYARYQGPIELIFSMIHNDEVWDESVDVRKSWDVQAKPQSGRRRKTAS